MTTRVIAKDFLNAVKVGGDSYRRKSTLPVLNGMLIRREPGKVTVISTDLETVSRDSTPTSTGCDNWAVVVPQKAVKDWIRALEPVKTKKETTMLEIEFENPPYGPFLENGKRHVMGTSDKLIIRCGNISARFNGIDAMEFPCVDNRIPAEGQLDHYKLPE